jgi:hypothetical protein
MYDSLGDSNESLYRTTPPLAPVAPVAPGAQVAVGIVIVGMQS